MMKESSGPAADSPSTTPASRLPLHPNSARDAVATAMTAYAAALGNQEPSDGSLDYLEVLIDAWDLHLRKVAGYGASDDAWRNFRKIEELGVSPLFGVVVRMNDKMSRINNLIADPGRDRIGEGVDRELSDMLGYSGIGKALIMEKLRRHED